MNRLSDKVALVSGAAIGLGAAMARAFIGQGGKVVIGDIREEEGRATAKELGSSAVFVKLDVALAGDWTSAVDAAVAEFGKLNVLVNNAGTWAGLCKIEDEATDAHRRILDVNLTGVWNGTRAAIPPMRQAGCGSIINISSIDGLAGVAEVTTYVASKWAVTGITRSTALQLGRDNIRVNAIHPGMIATNAWAKVSEAGLARYRKVIDRQPIARFGQPSEVANAAVFFASDESSYCTGASLLVDGGHLAGPYRDPIEE
jgi:3alpha(or 20beta)-hydroxysteroid dehydrogenase